MTYLSQHITYYVDIFRLNINKSHVNITLHVDIIHKAIRMLHDRRKTASWFFFSAHLSRKLKWTFLIACRPSVRPSVYKLSTFSSSSPEPRVPISTKLGTIILNTCIFITDPCKMTWLCWLQEVFILGLTSNSIYFQHWSWQNDMTTLVTEKSSFLPCLILF